ncbi:MAG: Rid family detoxifying hydrolase [Firmicutes bacterium]|nr:Rid family detoxifying hydrolase [Bacillota bacterium]
MNVPPLSLSVKANGLLFVSGRVPLDMQTGVVETEIGKATKLALKNMDSILKDNGLTVADVVKTTIFLIDLDKDYDTVNEIYAKHFKQPYPARSVVQVSKLPLNSIIEIECIAKLN